MSEDNGLRQLTRLLNEAGFKRALADERDRFRRNLDIVGNARSGNLSYLWSESCDVFTDLFISRLRRPAIVADDDLKRAFAQHLLDERELEFDDAYGRFCASVLLAADTELVSAPIPTITYDPIWGFDLGGAPEYITLWTNDTEEFSIRIAGELPAGPGIYGGDTTARTIYVSCSARCSITALNVASREVQQVVTSLLDSFRLLVQRGMPNERSEPGEIAHYCPWLADMREMLDAYFSASQKKDSIARRIRNAVHLLVQADKQSNHAVGLALSVASMEALLCRNAEGLSTMFAENAATLLEPEPSWRADAAKFAKGFYDKRSRILHGSETEFSVEEMRNGRFLAAAVMKAFVERRAFRRHSGYDDEKPDDLLNELRDDKYTPGQLTGVEESPAVSLWRTTM